MSATADLRRELDSLLAESPDSARERERTSFDRALAPFGTRLVLAGAGNLGRKALKALRAEGIEPLAFVDNNRGLWGSEIDGLAVLDPAEGAQRFGRSATFCVTIWGGEGTDAMPDRCRRIAGLGCENVIDFGAMFWKYPHRLMPHYSLDLPHKVLLAADRVSAAFALWHDDASRAEYVAQIRWRLHLDFGNLPPPVGERIYFPAGIVALLPDEVFVDCGAYIGDTINDFLARCAGRFRRVYAFEADPQNLARLERFVAQLPVPIRSRIEIVGKALADHAGFLHFSATGTAAAAVSASGVEVACVTLDAELPMAPTYVKMDIEGSEPAALRGAGRLIATHAPLLAVSAYHSQDHVWSIPLQIAVHRADYRMFLRPHVHESWDLVCYAVPSSRPLA